ncbi:MAG: hypothetical protein QOE59_4354 [Actinomycetota bacterium]|nr:hypothetical protein [Actinomycetota bacterium]
MTATDGRTRTGGEHPGPADPSGPDDAGRPAELPGGSATPAARAAEPDGGPAVARARARRASAEPTGSSDPADAPDEAPGPESAARAEGPRPPGRHALPDGAPSSGHTPPPDYRPRHAAPDAETERFAVVPAADAAPLRGVPTGRAHTPAHAAPDTAPPAGPPTPAAPDPSAIAPTPVRGLPLASTFPASGVTASEDVPQSDDKRPIFAWRAREGDDADGPTPERVRIVLAERRSPTRAVGTVAEIEAQTATGELLLSNLMRSQLTLALRLAAVVVLVLGVLPIVFLTMPAVSDAAPVLGIGLPWLLLGVFSFPFLLVLGWLYTRHAERNELDFADDVED